MRSVGAPQAVLRATQHSLVSMLPATVKQGLEKLGRITLALDGNAQGVALQRLQLLERARAANDGAMAFLQRPARPLVQRRQLDETLRVRRVTPAALQQPALQQPALPRQPPRPPACLGPR